jgi:hypothetical protein
MLATTGKGTAFSRADNLQRRFTARVKLVPFPAGTEADDVLTNRPAVLIMNAPVGSSELTLDFMQSG